MLKLTELYTHKNQFYCMLVLKFFLNIYDEYVWEWNFMDLEQRERNIILD